MHRISGRHDADGSRHPLCRLLDTYSGQQRTGSVRSHGLLKHGLSKTAQNGISYNVLREQLRQSIRLCFYVKEFSGWIQAINTRVH